MKVGEKKLKNSLLMIPSLVILLSFCIILITFNIVIDRYIEKMTAEQMRAKFDSLDAYFSESRLYTVKISDRDEPIIPVSHIIVENGRRILFPSEPWNSEKERRSAEAITRYFRNRIAGISEKKAIKIEVSDFVYYVKAKEYVGSYEGSLPSRDGKTEKQYTVFVYAEITPIQDFLDLLNRVLILLMCGFGLISVFAIFHMAKKVDGSLTKLKKYLIRVGRREALPEGESFAYEEFASVARTVREMSKMIERAEESQRKFFQNASHELRTPLMSIQGYAEGLVSGIIKDRGKAAEVILKESVKMAELVDEILLLSKMDLGGLEFQPEHFDLKELLWDCTWRIKAAADSRGLQIEHLLPEKEIRIFGSEKLIERAITNLLSNALRYARTEIRAECEVKEDEDEVRIRIIDDGEGIEEEELAKIFERFYKGEGGNFGIGLSLTREILHLHEGWIRVKSVPGRTVFEVMLPMRS